MNTKRISYVMMALVTLLSIATIALAAEGDLLFKKQSDKLTNLKAENQAIKDQQVSLAQAKIDIQKYENLNDIAKAIVPQDKDQAKTIREINGLASATGIKLQQINFDASSLGLPSTTAAGSASASSLTQVKPVTGITGVYALQIVVSGGGETSPVSYYQFLQFLEKLESNRRTAHVTSIDVTPSQENPNNVTFTLTLNAYLKP
ncbi:MAG TPA: hypothetical protein VFW77_02205 [Candidatus Saccharimonadales bacterium]|nr:hypothetical protein [Candidatus Saccharimonadales bacterium]